MKPKEGDSHPVGALPIGTSICQVIMLIEASMGGNWKGAVTSTLDSQFEFLRIVISRIVL